MPGVSKQDDRVRLRPLGQRQRSAEHREWFRLTERWLREPRVVAQLFQGAEEGATQPGSAAATVVLSADTMRSAFAGDYATFDIRWFPANDLADVIAESFDVPFSTLMKIARRLRKIDRDNEMGVWITSTNVAGTVLYWRFAVVPREPIGIVH